VPGALDFAETLEVLAAWERRRVSVSAPAGTARDPVPHAHAAMHGRLGKAQMGRFGILTAQHTTAYFPLGAARPGDSPQNGFFLKSDEFVRAEQPNARQLEIDAGAGCRIEVQLD
jgi:hypothetical protein